MKKITPKDRLAQTICFELRKGCWVHSNSVTILDILECLLLDWGHLFFFFLHAITEKYANRWNNMMNMFAMEFWRNHKEKCDVLNWSNVHSGGKSGWARRLVLGVLRDLAPPSSPPGAVSVHLDIAPNIMTTKTTMTFMTTMTTNMKINLATILTLTLTKWPNIMHYWISQHSIFQWRSRFTSPFSQGPERNQFWDVCIEISSPFTILSLYIIAYLIFFIFFTRTKFLKNKIYTEKRQFFALNL